MNYNGLEFQLEGKNKKNTNADLIEEITDQEDRPDESFNAVDA